MNILGSISGIKKYSEKFIIVILLDIGDSHRYITPMTNRGSRLAVLFNGEVLKIE
jgi:hypothetical protein